jgi:hypothetical protein
MWTYVAASKNRKDFDLTITNVRVVVCLPALHRYERDRYNIMK